MENPEAAVATHVHEEFPDVLAAIADDVASATADWPAAGVHDSGRVRTAIRTALQTSGVGGRLPRILESAVTELDASLPVAPVAAPPYVVVTSEGVLLRATLADARLVIQLQVVTWTNGRYRALDDVRVSTRLV